MLAVKSLDPKYNISGGGEMERDQISDPLKKSNIRYNTPYNIKYQISAWPQKLKYQISRLLKNQISDIKVPPFHPPPPIPP